MAPHLALVLGKPPRTGTIVADVQELLAGQGIQSSVVLPHETPRAGEPGVVEVLAAADLVVHRGLSRRVHPVLQALAEKGVALCNPWSGIRHTTDRPALHDALVAADIPTPGGRSVRTWEEVLALAADQSVVVKAADGGRGSGVVAGQARVVTAPGEALPDPTQEPLAEAVALSARQPLPEVAPGEGPYLVERLVDHDGMDRKLYVAGEVVHGLYKPSTLVREHDTEGEPFEVPADLRDLALAATAALDLHLAGVDVVVGDDGAFVVDVNPFPGYRSVAGAAESVAGHLLSHL